MGPRQVFETARENTQGVDSWKFGISLRKAMLNLLFHLVRYHFFGSRNLLANLPLIPHKSTSLLLICSPPSTTEIAEQPQDELCAGNMRAITETLETHIFVPGPFLNAHRDAGNSETRSSLHRNYWCTCIKQHPQN